VKRIRREGPSSDYVTQLHLYGAALRAQGEDIHEIALAYLPTDGTLADIFVWRRPVDTAHADKAMDRLSEVDALADPARAQTNPSPLCPWCSWHRPGATDLSKACPGRT
jgi:hypothetical protein